MSQTVSMPILGESVTEGTVTTWLKQVGEVVALDEPLLEVSTDKVDTEIPSPVAGVLLKILVAEDETVPVGTPLALIGSALDLEPDESTPAPINQELPNPEIPSTVTMSADGSAQVEWTYPSVPEIPAKAEEISPTPVPPSLPDAPLSDPISQTQPTKQPSRFNSEYATPIVRKLAAEKGVDLSQVKGTGVGGRIRKQDVLDAAGVFPETSSMSSFAPVSIPAPPPVSVPDSIPAPPPLPPLSEVSTDLDTPTVPATPVSPVPPALPSEPKVSTPQIAPRTAHGELDMARLAQLFAEVAAAFNQDKEVSPTVQDLPVPPNVPLSSIAQDLPVSPDISTPPAIPTPPSFLAEADIPAPPPAPSASQPQPSEPTAENTSAPTASFAPADSESGIPILMPSLGESVTEGTVTTWIKKVGDFVALDDPLLEVSTDKIDTEVPSPASGVISKIVVKEDETVKVGTVLGYVR